VTILKNASIDDGGSLQTNNGMKYARGQLTLDGAGEATQAIPNFPAASQVFASVSPNGAALTGRLSVEYAAGLVAAASSAGAADAGAIINYLLID
jgi:hypothetical protein